MMAKIISFEGCVGAGKTSLTNYFSYEMGMEKVLEEYERNPFLKEFYDGQDVKLETELTFLLIHYSQLKKAIKTIRDAVILVDFSIEKDLVYAGLNLDGKELEIFENVYNHVIQEVKVPDVVIYIDLSLKVLKRRIFQRGRPYEMKADIKYFKEYNDKVKAYFEDKSKSQVYFFDVDDLELDPDNKKLSQIRNTIHKVVRQR